jgi:tungstate transport system ATP-binding protein
MSAVLAARGLQITRGGRQVLSVENLEVFPGETLAVIGPNGAGKTTLLMALALLLKPARGEIFFQGRAVAPAQALAVRRRMSLVFQEPLLLHASVEANVMMGMRFRRLPAAETRQRAVSWMKKLGIEHLARRPAHRLSGGEAQRASLARALAVQPDVLLLDEPFSALDAPTRANLTRELKDLLAAERITTLLVTHDLDEALLLGDRVAVIIDGSVRQVGAPQAVFSAPRDPEVAQFVGVETVINGRVAQAQEGVSWVDAGGQLLECAGEIPAGAPVLLCLRPEDISLLLPDNHISSSTRNRIPGVVRQLAPQGPLLRVVVDCGFPVVALITRPSAREMALAEGSRVLASFKASAVHLIRR